MSLSMEYYILQMLAKLAAKTQLEKVLQITFDFEFCDEIFVNKWVKASHIIKIFLAEGLEEGCQHVADDGIPLPIDVLGRESVDSGQRIFVDTH